MAFKTPPTPKGVRQSEEILEAALRCLGRDGYSATSLARVAEEAGVSKRLVLYYFNSREALVSQLGKTIGDRLLKQLEDSLTGLKTPDEVVTTGFSVFWREVTSDRSLLIALFGVITESATDPSLHEVVSEFKNRFRKFLRLVMDVAREQGWQVVVDDDVIETAMVAGFMGLGMEWLERGDTPELRKTLAAFQRAVAALAQPPQSAASA